MASNFYYKNTPFTQIFSSLSYDFSYNKTLTNYTYNSSPVGTFNNTNGNLSIQPSANIPYYNNGQSITAGLSAYYVDFSMNGQYTLQIPSNCVKANIIIIGAGGSGGAGGGDTPGKDGAPGSAGGGGAAIAFPLSITQGYTYKVAVGKGGASVFGSAQGDNTGTQGISGEPTIFSYSTNGQTYTNYAIAKGGWNGTGGGASTTGADAPGGQYQSTDIVGGNAAAYGYSSGNISQGYNDIGENGYTLTPFTNKQSYPKTILSTYGNGGVGTVGQGDPNQNPTGPGIDGYCRVYYLY